MMIKKPKKAHLKIDINFSLLSCIIHVRLPWLAKQRPAVRNVFNKIKKANYFEEKRRC